LISLAIWIGFSSSVENRIQTAEASTLPTGAIWPSREAISPPHNTSESGFNAQGWTHGGLNFLAVSEIPAADLEQFVGEFKKRTQ
jgi:hypothetical protein